MRRKLNDKKVFECEHVLKTKGNIKTIVFYLPDSLTLRAIHTATLIQSTKLGIRFGYNFNLGSNFRLPVSQH